MSARIPYNMDGTGFVEWTDVGACRVQERTDCDEPCTRKRSERNIIQHVVIPVY